MQLLPSIKLVMTIIYYIVCQRLIVLTFFCLYLTTFSFILSWPVTTPVGSSCLSLLSCVRCVKRRAEGAVHVTPCWIHRDWVEVLDFCFFLLLLAGKSSLGGAFCELYNVGAAPRFSAFRLLFGLPSLLWIKIMLLQCFKYDRHSTVKGMNSCSLEKLQKNPNRYQAPTEEQIFRWNFALEGAIFICQYNLFPATVLPDHC